MRDKLWIRRERNALGYLEYDVMLGKYPVVELCDPRWGYDEDTLEKRARVVLWILRVLRIFL